MHACEMHLYGYTQVRCKVDASASCTHVKCIYAALTPSSASWTSASCTHVKCINAPISALREGTPSASCTHVKCIGKNQRLRVRSAELFHTMHNSMPYSPVSEHKRRACADRWSNTDMLFFHANPPCICVHIRFALRRGQTSRHKVLLRNCVNCSFQFCFIAVFCVWNASVPITVGIVNNSLGFFIINNVSGIVCLGKR